MRYDEGYGARDGWRRDERGNQSPERAYAPFRGHAVDDVHTRHPGEGYGRRERGDFATRGLTGRGEVDPRANLRPVAGETDFLGRPYGPAAYQNVPRGLYDQDHRQAALGRGYDRGMRGYDRSMRGYDRAMRGYDRGMRGTTMGYDRDFGALRGPYRGMGGVRPRGHGGGTGYGQDYEAVRARFGAGPATGRGTYGDPTWTDRWPRRR